MPNLVDNFSDDEVKEFMQQAQASGMTEEQLIAATAARGYVPSDIAKFIERALMVNKKTNVFTAKTANTKMVGSTDIEVYNKQIKKQVSDDLSESKRMKIFGLNIFKNQMLNFEPNLNIVTPRNYVHELSITD